jgi:phosphopantothenoylcysteine decarboxylase/phosphopantothenate--cysteine ligase
MNTRMWLHPAVQRNVAFLRDAGVHFIGPAAGWLACGDVGPGRMSEPAELLAEIVKRLARPPRRGGR